MALFWLLGWDSPLMSDISSHDYGATYCHSVQPTVHTEAGYQQKVQFSNKTQINSTTYDSETGKELSNYYNEKLSSNGISYTKVKINRYRFGSNPF